MNLKQNLKFDISFIQNSYFTNTNETKYVVVYTSPHHISPEFVHSFQYKICGKKNMNSDLHVNFIHFVQ
jgi:hypothetical protein